MANIILAKLDYGEQLLTTSPLLKEILSRLTRPHRFRLHTLASDEAAASEDDTVHTTTTSHHLAVLCMLSPDIYGHILRCGCRAQPDPV